MAGSRLPTPRVGWRGGEGVDTSPVEFTVVQFFFLGKTSKSLTSDSYWNPEGKALLTLP